MGEVCFCVSFIVVLYEVFRTCMDSQIPFRLIEIKMTIKTEGKKMAHCSFSFDFLFCFVKNNNKTTTTEPASESRENPSQCCHFVPSSVYQ